MDATPSSGRISLVGVPGDLIVNHHAVNQTLGQQARVLLPQLQRAQSAQVLALKSGARAVHCSSAFVVVLTLQCRSVCADLKKYLLRVLWYLLNSRVTQLSRDTHPGVHGCHSNAELLHGYYNDTVRNTWKDTASTSTYCHFNEVSPSRSHFIHQHLHPWTQVWYLRPGGGWEAPTEP